ncbi:hypothetical protein PG990_005293 [Apiospora arundinis]|uniref:Uncharacterized protein n=1 Tax=Apiospora arundinis TaxID=335852 RepID=A0ABR2J726_9PEZI
MENSAMLIISTLDRRMGACDDLSPQAERPFTRTVHQVLRAGAGLGLYTYHYEYVVTFGNVSLLRWIDATHVAGHPLLFNIYYECRLPVDVDAGYGM